MKQKIKIKSIERIITIAHILIKIEIKMENASVCLLKSHKMHHTISQIDNQPEANDDQIQ